MLGFLEINVLNPLDPGSRRCVWQSELIRQCLIIVCVESRRLYTVLVVLGWNRVPHAENAFVLGHGYVRSVVEGHKVVISEKSPRIC